jgi:hypothetical protein
MCIIRQRELSSDDLAFLASEATCKDDDPVQRSVGIYEPAGFVDYGPVPLSQIIRKSRSLTHTAA